MVSTILSEEIFFGLVPHAVAVQFVTVTLVLRVLFFGLQFRRPPIILTRIPIHPGTRSVLLKP
jgi:hypothetical protein